MIKKANTFFNLKSFIGLIMMIAVCSEIEKAHATSLPIETECNSNSYNTHFGQSVNEVAPGGEIQYSLGFYNVGSPPNYIACPAQSITGTISFNNNSAPIQWGSFAVDSGQYLSTRVKYRVPLDAPCGSLIQATNSSKAVLVSNITGANAGGSSDSTTLSVLVNCELPTPTPAPEPAPQLDQSLQCNINAFNSFFSRSVNSAFPGETVTLNVTLNNMTSSAQDVPCPGG